MVNRPEVTIKIGFLATVNRLIIKKDRDRIRKLGSGSRPPEIQRLSRFSLSYYALLTTARNTKSHDLMNSRLRGMKIFFRSIALLIVNFISNRENRINGTDCLLDCIHIINL